jgi:polyphosphate glucokinase
MKKSSAKSATRPAAPTTDARALVPGPAAPRTMAVDIGGTGIKALTLDPAGKPLNDRTRIATPKHARPKEVIAIVRKLAEAQSGFERVSVGFPGVVKDGLIYTAANLGKGWTGFDLRQALERKLKKPVRVANDADIQGLGCATGHGLELVITLGTGFGSVLFAEGTRVHLELGHHPFHRGKTYEDELGERALKKNGRKKWIKLLQEAISELQKTFNYDHLYIGGGNSRLVNFKLPANVKTISNEDGLLGGIALWRDAAKPTAKAAPAPVKSRAAGVPSKAAARVAKPAPVAASKPIAVSKPVAAASAKPKRAPIVAKPAAVAIRPAPIAANVAAPPASSESASPVGTSSSSIPPGNGSPQTTGALSK